MSIKKVMSLTLIVVMVLCSAVPAFGAIDYSQWNSQSAYPQDVVGTTYLPAVKFLVDEGAVTGDTDGLYHPENNITRAEIAKIMAILTNNANNLAVTGKLNLFNDLDGYGWAMPYINADAQAGIINGTGNGTFSPAKNVSYVEVLAMAVRTKASAAQMADSLGGYPNGYIKYAQMYNLTGDVNVTDWNAAATKGDVAKLIYKIMPKSSKTAGAVTLKAAKTTITGNETVAFTATVTGMTGNVAYEWRVNGNKIAGLNTGTASIALTETSKVTVSVSGNNTSGVNVTVTDEVTVTKK